MIKFKHSFILRKAYIIYKLKNETNAKKRKKTTIFSNKYWETKREKKKSFHNFFFWLRINYKKKTKWWRWLILHLLMVNVFVRVYLNACELCVCVILFYVLCFYWNLGWPRLLNWFHICWLTGLRLPKPLPWPNLLPIPVNELPVNGWNLIMLPSQRNSTLNAIWPSNGQFSGKFNSDGLTTHSGLPSQL